MQAHLLKTLAPAKVNLCLHVIGRRADLYHELESLVVFARTGDTLTLDPTRPLGLSVTGPTAAVSGASHDNLVLRAANHLLALAPNLQTGHFDLMKTLPVAAGLGGGSSDAAAALRLLAALNSISNDDPLIFEAARRTGADVPVCLEGVVRVMRGVGDLLDPPLSIEGWPAVLVNPRVAVETAAVFKALGLSAGEMNEGARLGSAVTEFDTLDALRAVRNDLQPPAVRVAPIIRDVLAELDALPGIALARMSGSGATCFGLFHTMAAAEAAALALEQTKPDWWIESTWLGSADCAVVTSGATEFATA